MATQEEDTQGIVQTLQDITTGLQNQDTRIESAVAGLHAQIDTLVNQQITPATAQALKDAVSALAQTAGGFAGIEPAPAPAQPAPDTGATPPADTTPVAPTDTTPVVDPAPADTTTPDAGAAPADTASDTGTTP